MKNQEHDSRDRKQPLESDPKKSTAKGTASSKSTTSRVSNKSTSHTGSPGDKKGGSYSR
jgi:hypothetical protein